MIREDAPTRAELHEPVVGTRVVCGRCGLPEHQAEFAPACPGGDHHEFREFPLCQACGGEGGRVRYTRGSRMPDPQTEVTCDRCEGSGVEGLL